MCDSDSEEFASADEDFEEIEPDELEEVLESVTPGDVSSKKSHGKQASVKSDVVPESNSSASGNAKTNPETNLNKESEGEETLDNALSRKAYEQKKRREEEREEVYEAQNEDQVSEENTELSSSEDLSTSTKKGNGPAQVDLISTNPNSSEQKTPHKEEKETDNSSQESNDCRTKASEKICQIDKHSKNYDIDRAKNRTTPTDPIFLANTTKSISGGTVKAKKMILKPARPQCFEEKPKDLGQSVEKLAEESNPQQPKPTAEEGWDDFDDDWGDFTVGGNAGGPTDTGDMKKKGPKQDVSEKPVAEGRPSGKASFKDVDIDDVENKLNDFMQHKDDLPLTSVLDRLSISEEGKASSAGQSWGGWKPSWGGAAVSFLSTASKSVASITTNITQVIESGIGVPNPEELARRQAETEAKLRADGYLREESEEVEPTGSARKPSEDRFGFDQLVSGVTQISSKVITGGLDTLEGIGKKTMTILQENDPGLLNKRKLLGLQPNDGVVLSQVLREAKAKTEEQERNLKQIQKHQYKKKLHFETLFDDYHGLVHLEALEMLSKQASLKLESLMAPLTGKALEDVQDTMSEVKELCELPEMDNDDADGMYTAEELEAKLMEAVVDLDPNVKVEFGEIVRNWTEYTVWINRAETTAGDGEARSAQIIFEKAMRALAQTTALCVLRMHKLAEMLLISEHHSTATEADVVVQLTTVFCWHLSGIATRFCSELTHLKGESGNDEDNTLVTNIFLECSNSTSYIQNAFQLFIPILQLGAA